MAEPFIGQIQSFAFNFAPQGWAYCNGQIMGINQNQALFALIGTMYGGDGVTTFALPDLRGRVALNQGQSSAGSNYALGQIAGQENVTLITSQMPLHSHMINAYSDVGDDLSPQNNFPAVPSNGDNIYYTKTPNATMNPQTNSNAGGSQPHTNMQPYLVINWCIALVGIFPSRN